MMRSRMSLRTSARLPACRSAHRCRKKLMRKVLSFCMRLRKRNHEGERMYLRYGCSTRSLASSITGK